MATVDRAQSLKRAILILRGRVEQTPGDITAALALAEALFRLAAVTPDPVRQAEHLARACQLDPYDPRLRMALGRARIGAGEIKLGIEALVAAATLAPGDPGPWIALGHALVAHYRAVPDAKVKLIERAIEAYDRALTAGQGDPELALALHAAKLYAAACARTAGRSQAAAPPVVKLVPATLKAIPPSPQLGPAVTWLAMSVAYALHYPKHWGTRNPKERMTPDDRKARARGFEVLRDAIAPWLAVAPALAMVNAAIDVLDAEVPDDAGPTSAAKCEAFARRVVEAAPRFTERALLHLVLHQKLEEIAEPALRVAVIRKVIEQVPLATGIDREMFAALNAVARTALVEGRFGDAQQAWRDGLELDRYCPAFHHNLALLALHQRDAARLAVHLPAAVELQLGQWCLDADRRDVLDRLAAQHAALAARLDASVSAEIKRADGDVSADLVAAWLGETHLAFVLRAVICALRRGTPVDSELRDLVAGYLRNQPVIGDPGQPPPPRIGALLDPVLRPPPLLYDVLKIAGDATADAIARASSRERDEAQQMLAAATARGDRARMTEARQRLERIEEARATLTDPQRRAAYDARCMSMDDHAYNRARYQFIDRLDDHVAALVEKDKYELVRLMVRAYRQLPHDHMAEYFRPGELDRICRTMITSATRLPHLDELMDRKNYDEAYTVATGAVALLDGWRTATGPVLAHVHYFLAILEMQREEAYVHKHGVLSAGGMSVPVRAATRLEELGGKLEDKDG